MLSFNIMDNLFEQLTLPLIHTVSPSLCFSSILLRKGMRVKRVPRKNFFKCKYIVLFLLFSTSSAKHSEFRSASATSQATMTSRNANELLAQIPLWGNISRFKIEVQMLNNLHERTLKEQYVANY